MFPSLPGDAENTFSPEPQVLEGQGSFKLEGWWLKLSQFHGLIIKRFHCAKRNTKGLFSQILLPAFFVCVAMTVALSVPEIGEILHVCMYYSCFLLFSVLLCSWWMHSEKMWRWRCSVRIKTLLRYWWWQFCTWKMHYLALFRSIAFI